MPSTVLEVKQKLLVKRSLRGVPVVAQWKRIRLGTMRFRVRSLATLSGLRIRCCHELWCRSLMRLGSGAAVVLCRLVATAPTGPLAWEPPLAMGAALEKTGKKKRFSGISVVAQQ